MPEGINAWVFIEYNSAATQQEDEETKQMIWTQNRSQIQTKLRGEWCREFAGDKLIGWEQGVANKADKEQVHRKKQRKNTGGWWRVHADKQRSTEKHRGRDTGEQTERQQDWNQSFN